MSASRGTPPPDNRAAAARAWFRRQKAPKSAAQAMAALDPNGNADSWHSTLRQLAKAKHLQKHGHGHGVKYSWLGQHVAKGPWVTGNICRSKTPAPRKPSASMIHIEPARPGPCAPPAKAATHETVDQFIARGGRVQKLPQNSVSQPLKHDYSRDQHARSPVHFAIRGHAAQ